MFVVAVFLLLQQMRGSRDIVVLVGAGCLLLRRAVGCSIGGVRVLLLWLLELVVCCCVVLVGAG